jgi:hypothetical protein
MVRFIKPEGEKVVGEQMLVDRLKVAKEEVGL